MRAELRWLPIALAIAPGIELLGSAVAEQSKTSRLDYSGVRLELPRSLSACATGSGG